MYNTVFILIIAFLVLGFILDKWLDYLNIRHYTDQLPEELADVYDTQRYQESRKYQITNTRFSFVSGSFSFLLILLMFFLGGFAWVNSIAFSFFDHYILVALFFFSVLSLASDITGIPFELYDTFVIEEKFGFNKVTPKLFVLDKIKSWILGLVIGGLILSAVVWFYQLTGKNFWIFAWITASLFSLFMLMFYSNLIVPLFNKQTPLEEGELRKAIEKFAVKVGFPLTGIFVIDGSKRSTKSNAYFTGLGSKKRIVLYDTLIEDLETEELVAVLAHEIGHYKKKHTLSGFLLSTLQTGITLFIFSLFLDNPQLSLALGVAEPNFHLSVVAFGILYSPVSLVIGIFFNRISRKNEFKADEFAALNFSPDALISALKKLSRKNLSNLTPHPLYVFFNDSHPPLMERISAMQAN